MRRELVLDDLRLARDHVADARAGAASPVGRGLGTIRRAVDRARACGEAEDRFAEGLARNRAGVDADAADAAPLLDDGDALAELGRLHGGRAGRPVRCRCRPGRSRMSRSPVVLPLAVRSAQRACAGLPGSEPRACCGPVSTRRRRGDAIRHAGVAAAQRSAHRLDGKPSQHRIVAGVSLHASDHNAPPARRSRHVEHRDSPHVSASRHPGRGGRRHAAGMGARRGRPVRRWPPRHAVRRPERRRDSGEAGGHLERHRPPRAP